jgi:hypothetical protein
VMLCYIAGQNANTGESHSGATTKRKSSYTMSIRTDLALTGSMTSAPAWRLVQSQGQHPRRND